MTAVLKLPVQEVPWPQVGSETRALINRLRFHASLCRASAHLDIHVACGLIDPNSGEDAAARTLIRVLAQALDRTPVWLRPGEISLSFDECWLAQVIEARRGEDFDSLLFLTHRRIAGDKRRLFGMLVANLACAAT
ncbi:hypothetical protein [uncultured Tateyamaria sp.]|uniref:hypothetical protein n=1 Tax=uncultured Tateyamaria sp. TaxID=455651 RepID=UPI002626EDF2|nr:hypothetical protein [uncultured Tateyamaria sp.]